MNKTEIIVENNVESNVCVGTDRGNEVCAMPGPQWKETGVDRRYLSGSGVIELILIIVVLIAVVILFKGQITALADLIFGDIFTKAGTVF